MGDLPVQDGQAMVLLGGNTVLDLAARWDGDVLAERPGWLSVMTRGTY